MIMSFKNKFSLAVLALISVGMLTIESCVKEGPIETYAPGGGGSCFDFVQNQGEYGVDCGGPCAPCTIEKPFLTVTVDSTWVHDSIKTENRFWTPNDVYVNDSVMLDSFNISANVEYLIVHAVDIMGRNPDQFISLTFKIPKDLTLGVHEISVMESYEVYASEPPDIYPGTAKLLNGVISITKRDDVYGYISGRFEFNTEPVDEYKYRVALIDGEFRDIPLN
jgi:hypothetical protein